MAGEQGSVEDGTTNGGTIYDAEASNHSGSLRHIA